MAEPQAGETEDLIGRTSRSAAWRALETAGSEGLSFLLFVVMARLLIPEHFGLVALASSIVMSLQCLLQFGIPEALIQRPRLSPANIRSAMSASFMLGLALLMLAVVLAWPLAWLLGRDEFPPIFLALSCVLIFQSLSFPLHGLLRRALDLKSIAIRTLVATSVGGLVAILLARAGYGPWALVAQQLTVAGIGLLMLLRVSTVKPWPFDFQWREFRPLIHVAKSFMLSQFASQSARKLDTVALGLFMGNHEVGIYFLVTRLIQAAQTVSQFSIGEISLAVLSRLQHDPERLRAGIRRAMRLTGFGCLYFFGVLALVAPAFVPTLFGEQMSDAAEPLRVLALFATAGALISTAVHVLIAVGAARSSTGLAVGASLVQLIAVLISARFGMMNLVIGIGLAQLVMVIPAFYLLQRREGIAVSQLALDQLLVVAGFVIAWWLGLQAALGEGLGPAALGVAVYTAIMLTVGGWVFRRDLGMMWHSRQSKQSMTGETGV
ncbi:MAG: oligosaccharide flippase family protein [Burkholderiaceae bacterium]